MHRATFDLVWLGVLILTPGVGVPAGPVCPAFPRRFRLGLAAGGRGRPVGVVPGWPGTAGTRPAPTASAAEGASGGGGGAGQPSRDVDQLGAGGTGGGFGVEGRGQADEGSDLARQAGRAGRGGLGPHDPAPYGRDHPGDGTYPVEWTQGLAARFVGSFRNGFDTP